MTDFVKFRQTDGGIVTLRKSNIIQLFRYEELKLIYYYAPDEDNGSLRIESNSFGEDEDYDEIVEALLND